MDRNQIVDQLREVKPFGELDTRALQRIAGLFERVSCKEGDCITQQGEPDDRLLLVESGELAVWHMDSAGLDEQVGALYSGDWFGDAALFDKEPCEATLRATEESVVLSLRRSRFDQHLQVFPAVRDALVLPEELEDRLRAPRFSWMRPDERTVLLARKTRWALISAQVFPVFIFALLMAVAAAIRGMTAPPAVLVLLAALVSGTLAFARWYDWRNDYYVVTNKRVVHHESRLPTLQVTVDQAPLHQIQNVTMLKPGPAAQALNYGTLVIQTAGRAGSITFRNLDDPEHCQATIFELLEEAGSSAIASERAAIREAIAQRLQGTQEEAAPPLVDSAGEVVSDVDVAAPPPADRTHLLAAVVQAVLALLPHFRQEEGDTVTWRKHPFVLFKAILMPTILLLASLLGGMTWTAIGGQPLDTVVVALFAAWCVGLFWLLWKYEDWRNDIFQMTASHIVDIDRLPLGLRESKRQASLEQVQNINVDIPNVWARLFNYGNVVIETAGAAGDLTFEWVMRPRAVQKEIFDRIDATRATRRAEETQRRRDEMSDWFTVYHEMREQQEI
jgi:membrane protein YdbS with pleckstrin-like domain